MARLLDAGFRIALTRSETAEDEWGSVLKASGDEKTFYEHHDVIKTGTVVDFLLRSPDNPSSVYSCFKAARANGRIARTALTRDMWEAINESWIRLNEDFQTQTSVKELPSTLSHIRQHCALVRGVMEGTMVRNDCYDFAKLGMFIERAGATARLFDVKYYLLLPSAQHVGGPVDHSQWERILRSVSAERAFHWLYPGETNTPDIAAFLIMDRRMPRSLKFCSREITHAMDYLRSAYKFSPPSYEKAYDIRALVDDVTIEQVFKIGLHEFVNNFLEHINALAAQIEVDYRFYK